MFDYQRVAVNNMLIHDKILWMKEILHQSETIWYLWNPVNIGQNGMFTIYQLVIRISQNHPQYWKHNRNCQKHPWQAWIRDFLIDELVKWWMYLSSGFQWSSGLRAVLWLKILRVSIQWFGGSDPKPGVFNSLLYIPHLMGNQGAKYFDFPNHLIALDFSLGSCPLTFVACCCGFLMQKNTTGGKHFQTSRLAGSGMGQNGQNSQNMWGKLQRPHSTST